MRLIVTIDGGGIRGVLPLVILKEIQARLGHNFYDLNPVFWGTSTGAIISASLCVQKMLPFADSVQRVLDLYEFRSKAFIQPKSKNRPERAVGQLIVKNFSGFNLTDFPQLNIVASELEGHAPVVFNQTNPAALEKAVLASCAFPGVFPPVEIEGKFYTDGFYNAKNPAEIAVNSSTTDNNTVVLSLGTGKLRRTDKIELAVQAVDEKLQKQADAGAFYYTRMNPTLQIAADDMQNVTPKNVLNLRKDAQLFIAENTALIDDLVVA